MRIARLPRGLALTEALLHVSKTIGVIDCTPGDGIMALAARSGVTSSSGGSPPPTPGIITTTQQQ